MQVYDETNTKINEMNSQDKMVNGSAWMTGGSILSRVVGVLYIIRIVINGEVVDAVSASTFGAFVRALFSALYLLFVIWRKKS
ncbi:hypothetical protein SAMN04488700_0992 [Carnobacterium iners]|uniref:Uncharacterized protein n=1 Tax=Carnobacterium iners TaxID=1073423 RepID=A0A1X7MVZ7_9LACT|nr:hypothetical protein [Carnobacterium iners]SEL26130.1 hypothetical protein SAMN04488114_1432 [Carnobacterium iners]SMH28877.1 hypothetical protein SAMN04488700_0992 [Carnobacterium iners]